MRNQYGHVIDILPTTLELVGLKAPEKIREIQQDTIQGISLAYAVNSADAASKRNQQYYYIFGSRAIYKDGWKAAFAFEPKAPLLFNNYSVENPGANEWKLYNIEKDFNERTDLSKKYPQKLEELKALFDEEARRNNLYPLITWDDVIQGVLKQRQQQAQNKH